MGKVLFEFMTRVVEMLLVVISRINSLDTDFNKYDKLGIYEYGCGLEFTYYFGHDEYLYQVLKQNKNHNISEKYLDIIRYQLLSMAYWQ